jgi:uncharacterized repeat protein (TIGR02543 family)
VDNTTAQPVAPNSFGDVKPSDWFYDAVTYVKQNGIFSGTSNDSFSPDGTLTRAMYVTVLGRMAGIDVSKYTTSVFTDVQPDAWYAPYVQWAFEKGITSGTGDNVFSPDASILREQMATLTLRYFEIEKISYQTKGSKTSKPNDISDISAWAVDAVVKLWQAGLLAGDTNGNFNPSSNATRAEAAAFCVSSNEVVKAWMSQNPTPPTAPPPTAPPPTAPPPIAPPPTAPPPIGSNSNSGGNDQSSNSAPITYTITFDSNGGAAVGSLSLQAGASLGNLPLTTKERYIFNGWFKDSALTQPVMNDDTVGGNMTLYADYSALPDSAVKSVPSATAMDQAPSFTVAVSDSTGTMAASDVQAGMTFHSTTDLSFAGIVVTGSNGSFTVAAKDGTFKEGNTYQITLTNSNLTFTAQDPTTKIYVFSIAKQEVAQVPLNADMNYIQFSDVSNMTERGTSVASPSIAVMSASIGSGASNLASASRTSGTFQYNGSTSLKVGDTVAIYEGTRPDLRTLATSDDGNIAYVAITEINGNTYTYTNADTQNVLMKPYVLPVDPASDTDGDTANHSITVAPASMDYSDAKYAPMGLNATTFARVGDFLSFVDMHTPATPGTKRAPIGYGKVTSVTTSQNNYVIVYTDATQDDITHALDFYKQTAINGTDMLSQADKTVLEAQIKQQAYSSGFVDAAANYLSTTAVQTEVFKTFNAANAPQVSQLEEEDEPKVTVHNLQVSANIGTTLNHFQGKTGVQLKLTVSSDIQISNGGDNDILIHMSAAFVEEMSLGVGADASTVWGYIDLGLFDLPYPKDYQVSANLDAYTFTSIDASAQIGTIAADTPIDKWSNIWDTARNKVDMAAQFKALLQSNPTAPAQVNANTLAASYQDMLKNETEWVDLVEKNLYEKDQHLMYGIINLKVKADFVVSLNPNVTLGIGFSYQTAKRYTASFKLSEGSPHFDTVNLPGDGTYDFYFYVMGTIGLRAGIRFEIAAGLLSTDLDSIGIKAEAGAYLKLYGYFYYRVSSSVPTQMLGAMYLQIGIYLEAELEAQLGEGSLSATKPIYSNEWPLYTIDKPGGHFIDFAYTQEEAPSLVGAGSFKGLNGIPVETSGLDPNNIFQLNALNLVTGDVGVDPEHIQDDLGHYTFSVDSSQFTVTSLGGIPFVAVTPKVIADQKITQVNGNLIVTWKGATTGLNSIPISRKIPLTWYREDRVMITLDPNCSSLDDGVRDSCSSETLAKKRADVIQYDLNNSRVRTSIPGYTFKGWSWDPQGKQPINTRVNVPVPDTNTTVYAQWTPNSDVRYKVEHYTVNPTTGSAEMYWQGFPFFPNPHPNNEYTGTAGASVSPETLMIAGYDTPPTQTATISGSGKTVIRYYYERPTHKMTFYSDPGDTSQVYSAKSFSRVPNSAAPIFTKRGYTFMGWSPAIPEDMPSNDTTYTATWQANTDTPYQVVDMLQGFGSNSTAYVKAGTGSFRGTTGATAQPTANAYPGFTYNRSTAIDSGGNASGKIAGDGSLTIVRYYTRNSYNLKFDANGGTGGTTAPVQYGAAIQAPTVTKAGYTLAGWSPALASTMPASNTTYTANWTPASGVSYKVVHMLQNLGTSTYTLADTDNLHGTTGATVQGIAKTYPGFTYDTSSTNSGTVAADGSLIITLRYTRNSYNLTFNANGGTGGMTASVQYGAAMQAPTVTKAGYTFAGWSPALPSTMPASNTTYTANWTPASGVGYKVVHMLQDLGTSSYTLADTDNLQGTTGASVQGIAKTYPGFTYDTSSTNSGIVAVDGSLIITLRYTRNSYNLTFNANGGTGGTGGTTASVQYGAAIQAPTVTRATYTFSGWSPALASTMPASDATYTANWTPASGVSYKVVHMLEDVGASSYTLADTDNLQGTTGASVQGTAKTYPGFTYDTSSTNSGVVAADGSLIITLRYTRNSYNLVFDASGGTGGTTAQVQFGAAIQAPTVTRATYTFSGWSPALASTMPASDATYTAQWISSFSISTVVGIGVDGYSGDGGPATTAQLKDPWGVALDSSGNLYIADDESHTIRKVDKSTGNISTVAGTGVAGYSGDGGAATSAQLDTPRGVTIDSNGNVYIADYTNNRVRKVNKSTGTISTIAGTGVAGYSGDGVPATSAQLNNPIAVLVDSLGNVYIADMGNQRIRKVDSSGTISTVAGTGVGGHSGDGGLATSAQLSHPMGLALDSGNNLYVAENGNTIRKINPSGIISTVAGTGGTGYSGDDGPATSALMSNVSGVAVDGLGNVYIADTTNHRIRKVDQSTGIISTVVGTGVGGYSGDGGAATLAKLYYPHGVVVDSNGTLYIGESNHVIRKVN